MSTRAIAPVAGISQRGVSKIQQKVRTEFSPEPDPLESNDRKTTGVKTLYTSPEHPEPDPIPDDPASGPEVIDFETGEVVETEPRRA